jgi:hypothetical protein
MLNDLGMHPQKNSWAKSVKELLDHLGFSYVWLFQGVGNKTLFLKYFKSRLTDGFIQNWISQ